MYQTMAKLLNGEMSLTTIIASLFHPNPGYLLQIQPDYSKIIISVNLIPRCFQWGLLEEKVRSPDTAR